MPRSFLVKKKDGKSRKAKEELTGPSGLLSRDGAPRRLLTSLSSTGSSPGQLSEDSGIEEPTEPLSSPEPSPGVVTTPRVSEPAQRLSWSASPRVLTYVETEARKTLESPPATPINRPHAAKHNPYWPVVGQSLLECIPKFTQQPEVTTNLEMERPPRPRIWRSPGIDENEVENEALIEDNGAIIEVKPDANLDDVFGDDRQPPLPVGNDDREVTPPPDNTPVTSSYANFIRRHEPIYIGKTPSPRFHPYDYYSRHSTPISRELCIVRSSTYSSVTSQQVSSHQMMLNSVLPHVTGNVTEKVVSPKKSQRLGTEAVHVEGLPPAGPHSPSWDIENRPIDHYNHESNRRHLNDLGMSRLPLRSTELPRERPRETLRVSQQEPLHDAPPPGHNADNQYRLPARELFRNIYQQSEPFREIPYSEPQRDLPKTHIDPLRQLNTIDPLREFPQSDITQGGLPYRDYRLGANPRGDPPRFQCEDCHKSYATYSGLTKHRQFHCAAHVKKEFSCKHCNKTYVSLGALKMHIRTHTLPCKCHLCGKAFSRPWLLQGHIRTHTGEKPFQCQHCSRSFADRSNLRAHLQTHTDIKKYNCKQCAKTFSRMSLLLKHEEGGCTAMCMTCA